MGVTKEAPKSTYQNLLDAYGGEIDIMDKIEIHRYLGDTYGYLTRDEGFYEEELHKKPGDITAMANLKKIRHDKSILEPLIQGLQTDVLEEFQGFIGREFAYIHNR